MHTTDFHKNLLRFSNKGTDTLVINRDGNPVSLVPISTIGWQEAIKFVVCNQVEVIAEYSDWFVESPTIRMAVPSIIMTNEYVNINKKRIRATKFNILLRDGFKCQYCGVMQLPEDLTIDHVYPKSKGGIISWENSVAACLPCNNKKSNSLDIKPKIKPEEPNYWKLLNTVKTIPIKIADERWIDYLGWNRDLVDIRGSDIMMYN